MKIKLVRLWKDLEERVRIERGHLERDWMDNTNEKYAYRCLPLNIANQHGWAVYPKKDIVVRWNGDGDLSDIEIINNDIGLAASIFGNGILTFHLPFLIRTEEDYSLYISGAPNHHVVGAEALTGIYETDWAPYSFTMNWQLNMIDEEIVFSKDDPICFFFPIHRTLIEDFVIEYEDFWDQEEEFRVQHKTFVDSRNTFLDDDKREVTAWQKNYFQGKMPDGSGCPVANHKTKINLKSP